MLVFIHINKTAGRTVRYILRSSYGTRHCEVEPWHSPWEDSPFSASDLQRLRRIYPNLKSIAGHRLRGYVDLEANGTPNKYFTIMRDPLKTCASRFQFNVHRKNKNLVFEEWIQQERVRNAQTKMIASSGDAAEAIRVIAEAAGVTGPGEDVKWAALDWIGRLPLLGAFELSMLLGVGEREAATLLSELRRCGWLDGVLLRYAARLNSLTDLFITKLDVLSGFERVRGANAYSYQGEVYGEFPPHQSIFHHCEPVYEELDGWTEDVSGARAFADLPLAAQRYIRRVEELAGVPVTWVGVGPEREQMVTMDREAVSA